MVLRSGGRLSTDSSNRRGMNSQRSSNFCMNAASISALTHGFGRLCGVRRTIKCEQFISPTSPDAVSGPDFPFIKEGIDPVLHQVFGVRPGEGFVFRCGRRMRRAEASESCPSRRRKAETQAYLQKFPGVL